MICFPNAKINIGLSIIRKRTDGYHDLNTLFYPVVSLYDCLECAPANSFSFKSYGATIDGNPEKNLCVLAYNLLKEDFDIAPVSIVLYKNIPIGAGMGGGSSDGAFTLKLLNDFFSLGLTNERLAEYAIKLGSDCPFFIYNKPCIAEGRGEILKEFTGLSLKNLYLIVVKPPSNVSTAEAYSKIKPLVPEIKLSEVLKMPVYEWKNYLFNDFEKTVFPSHKEIENIKINMYNQGALYSSMSGSGSTVFGIFPNQISLYSGHSDYLEWGQWLD